MYFEYDISRLEKLLNDFYDVTGLSIGVYDSEYKSVTNNNTRQEFCRILQENDNEKCMNSDEELLTKCAKTKRAVIHICHAGLVDAVMPIIINDEVAGYIIMGQVRRTLDFDEIADSLPKKLLPELRKYYDRLEDYSNNQIESALRIVSILITTILKEQMIKMKKEHFSDVASEYINSHLSEDLCVKNLCKNLNVSKNLLYNCFNKDLGCTVNRYIIKKRIEKAAELLKSTALSTIEIAEISGISDYSYFCKLFKKETGYTPLKYRQKSDYNAD